MTADAEAAAVEAAGAAGADADMTTAAGAWNVALASEGRRRRRRDLEVLHCCCHAFFSVWPLPLPQQSDRPCAATRAVLWQVVRRLALSRPG